MISSDTEFSPTLDDITRSRLVSNINTDNFLRGNNFPKVLTTTKKVSLLQRPQRSILRHLKHSPYLANSIQYIQTFKHWGGGEREVEGRDGLLCTISQRPGWSEFWGIAIPQEGCSFQAKREASDCQSQGIKLAI